MGEMTDDDITNNQRGPEADEREHIMTTAAGKALLAEWMQTEPHEAAKFWASRIINVEREVSAEWMRTFAAVMDVALDEEAALRAEVERLRGLALDLMDMMNSSDDFNNEDEKAAYRAALATPTPEAR